MGRISCPPHAQEAFFAASREHLWNFLTGQGPVTAAGDSSVGSTSARAAVSTGNDAAKNPAPPAVGVVLAAIVARLQAHRLEPWNETARLGPHGTKAQRNVQGRFARRPRSPGARQRSSRLKDPFCTWSASTTGRTPPTLIAPIGLQARAGRTAVEGAGPRPASIHPPPLLPLFHRRGGGGSGRRPACHHAGAH
jgi:hypothetical protein